MYSKLWQHAQQALWHFFLTKTPREKLLLCVALALIAGYFIVECIYTPLLAQYNALSQIHTHTLQQLNLSLDSLHNSTQLAQEEQQTFQDMQHINTLLRTHLVLSPNPKPLLLIPNIIELAKNSQLTLLALEPNPATSSLNIKGYGEFENLKTLLAFLESHHFLSLDSLTLSPNTPHSVNFVITLVNHIPDTPKL